MHLIWGNTSKCLITTSLGDPQTGKFASYLYCYTKLTKKLLTFLFKPFLAPVQFLMNRSPILWWLLHESDVITNEWSSHEDFMLLTCTIRCNHNTFLPAQLPPYSRFSATIKQIQLPPYSHVSALITVTTIVPCQRISYSYHHIPVSAQAITVTTIFPW